MQYSILQQCDIQIFDNIVLCILRLEQGYDKRITVKWIKIVYYENNKTALSGNIVQYNNIRYHIYHRIV